MQSLHSDKGNTNPNNLLSSNSSSNTANPDENTDLNSGILTQTSLIGTSFTSAIRPKFSFASNYSTNYNYCGLSAPLRIPTSAASFSVLNNDYVSYRNKPNAIVHPIRRLQPKHHHNALEQELRVLGYNSSLSVTHPQIGASNTHHFANELNRKLSQITSVRGTSPNFRLSSHHGSNKEQLNQRPLFITTVARGIFLPPPREIILLSSSRKRQLYTYSSHPLVYNAIYSTLKSSHNGNTHNGHKIKTTSQRNYTHRNTSIMAKDKYCKNGNNDFGGEPAIASDGSVNTIVERGKADTIIKESSELNSITECSDFSPPVSGGQHITKQQYQQPLHQTRSRRDIAGVESYKNVMYEKRIVRGTNFGGNQFLGEYDAMDKAAEYRRRQMLRKRNITQKNQRNVLGSPPPVKGRRHADVQTEKYLEELIARPTEYSTETQTDLFLEKPSTPPYIPAKIGINVATEIDKAELSEFEEEVQPIIDVLVDSILEMSILKVTHENEIADIRLKQEQLLAERERELAELRRLEEEDVRLKSEKERLLRQDKISKAMDTQMQAEVTASTLLQRHIAGILPEVLNNLKPETDSSTKQQLPETIYPWLSAEVAKELCQIVDSREIITVIIQEIIKQRAETYGDCKEEGVPTEVEHSDAEGQEEEDSHQAIRPPDNT